MTTHQDLLSATSSHSQDDLINIISRHKLKSISLDEALGRLSANEQRMMWKSLAEMSQNAIKVILGGDTESPDAYSALALIDAVSHVAHSNLVACEGTALVDPFVKTLNILHEVMLSLPLPMAASIQTEIATACELFWTQERPGRDSVVPATITYLILKALDPSARPADVRRVHAMRTGLLLFDYNDASSEGMKMIVCRCVVCPAFLRIAEGRRLCSFFFGLYPPLIDSLHSTIKNQIPGAKKSVLTAFGDIYMTAWRHASGPYLFRIEHVCLSDLTYATIHASSVALSTSLRRVLGVFHSNKRHAGVDAMLLRTYAPILWKSLSVANPLVRRNAAALLIDGFPLQDPDAPIADIDSVMQQQFNHLDDLLSDPVPAIRVVAVQGVCRVLGIFWELVPAPVTRSFLLKLVNDMASDAASASVRAAVFDGLSFLLDNHLAQPALKTILPVLGPLISDSSQQVRAVFYKMLVLIKGMRGIQFYDIVTVEDLLDRLVIESTPLQLAITEVLLTTYLPFEQPVNEQVGRVIECVRRNRDAAHVFYGTVHEYVPLGAIARLIRRLCRTVAFVIEEEEAETLHKDDVVTIEGMLNTAAILWQTCASRFEPKVVSRLAYTFEEGMLATILDAYPDSPIVKQALLSMASHLKASGIPSLSKEAMPELSSMSPMADEDEFGSLVECLCAWGRTDELVDLLIDWLDKKKKKRGRQPVDRRLLSLKIIKYIMSKEVTRHSFLHCNTITTLLSKLECTERLAGELNKRECGEQYESAEIDVLLESMERWALIILQRARLTWEQQEEDADQSMMQPPIELQGMSTWVQAVVAPYTRTGKPAAKSLGASIAQRAMTVLLECPALGVDMDGWASDMVTTCEALLGPSEEGLASDEMWKALISPIGRFTYQIVHGIPWHSDVHDRLITLFINASDDIGGDPRFRHSLTAVIGLVGRRSDDQAVSLSKHIMASSVCVVEDDENPTDAILADMPPTVQAAIRPWTHTEKLYSAFVRGWGAFITDCDADDVTIAIALHCAAKQACSVSISIDPGMIDTWLASIGQKGVQGSKDWFK